MWRVLRCGRCCRTVAAELEHACCDSERHLRAPAVACTLVTLCAAAVAPTTGQWTRGEATRLRFVGGEWRVLKCLWCVRCAIGRHTLDAFGCHLLTSSLATAGDMVMDI